MARFEFDLGGLKDILIRGFGTGRMGNREGFDGLTKVTGVVGRRDDSVGLDGVIFTGSNAEIEELRVRLCGESRVRAYRCSGGELVAWFKGGDMGEDGLAEWMDEGRLRER